MRSRSGAEAAAVDERGGADDVDAGLEDADQLVDVLPHRVVDDAVGLAGRAARRRRRWRRRRPGRCRTARRRRGRPCRATRRSTRPARGRGGRRRLAPTAARRCPVVHCTTRIPISGSPRDSFPSELSPSSWISSVEAPVKARRSDVHAAVDADDLAGDVAAVVRAQERARTPRCRRGCRPGRAGPWARPRRRRGSRRRRPPCRPSGCRTRLGGMVLAVIPLRASSTARALVSLITPPFDAA